MIALLSGCGTTRKTDSARSATEQLVLSTAIDRAVNNIDFTSLAGRSVFLDTQYLTGTTDEKYLISSLRQHLVAYGCELRTKLDDADIIVEARSGGVGTDRQDLLMGIPQVTLPNVAALPGVGFAAPIPEIAVAKTTHQIGVAKIAVFAYHRESGLAVWQSGAFPAVADARDSWILSAGPFQRGTVYDGTRFAGNRIMLTKSRPASPQSLPPIPVTAEAVFPGRPEMAKKGNATEKSSAPAAATASARGSLAPPNQGVVNASHGQVTGPQENGVPGTGAAAAAAANSPQQALSTAPAATAGADADRSDSSPAGAVRGGRRRAVISATPTDTGDPMNTPRIVRLPVVERKDRPDLFMDEDADSRRGRATNDDPETGPAENGDGEAHSHRRDTHRASDEDDGDSATTGFEIFDPRTWFP